MGRREQNQRHHAKYRSERLEANRQWRLRNREHLKVKKAQYAREHRLAINCQLRGLTVEKYEEMQLAQGNRCAICKTDNPGVRRRHWAVDHDHVTGRIRGLCTTCNSGIGMLKDDPAVLEAAITYLKGAR